MFQYLLPNIADYGTRYAKERPKETAIIEHNTGETVTWKQFDTSVSAFAAKLLSIGLVKGDIVATSPPLLKEHVYLIYACYRAAMSGSGRPEDWKEFPEMEQHMISAITVAANRLLKDNWTSVEAIAEILIEKKELGYTEASSIAEANGLSKKR